MGAPDRAPFRTGRVAAYLRNDVWYLDYFQDGRRKRPRVGRIRADARKLAAQVNAQLEAGGLPVFEFEPISIPELRARWLEHHEHVLRSSLATINRYRTATDHLLGFVASHASVKLAAAFKPTHAEAFVRHLRCLLVSPNGHAHTEKRRLLDKGLKYILQTCRALFNYALKRRHLIAYAPNPFSTIQIERIPIETARPIVLLTPEQEVAFLDACDEWQFPIFLTLMMTGLRPGEVVHLLAEDVDLRGGVLHVRNKPELGWLVKTRQQRDLPLHPVLAQVLEVALGDRRTGAVIRRRACGSGVPLPLDNVGAERVASSGRTRMNEIATTDRSLHVLIDWRRRAASGRTSARSMRTASGASSFGCVGGSDSPPRRRRRSCGTGLRRCCRTRTSTR